MRSTPSSASPEAPRHRLLLIAVAAAIVLAIAIITFVAVSNDPEVATPSRDGRAVCRASVSGTETDVGGVAPTFELPGLDGGCVRMQDAAGSPTIVNFWASWCNPCRREFPMLQDAFDRYHADGLEVIGVTYRDIESDAQAFAEDEGANWSLAHDEEGVVAKAYGVNTIPQTFFVDDRGRVTGRVFGALTRTELDRELAKILPRSATPPLPGRIRSATPPLPGRIRSATPPLPGRIRSATPPPS